MRLRTITEAVRLLGVSRRRLMKGVLDGDYPALRWGNRILVDVEALEAMIREEDEARPEHGTVPATECAELLGLKRNTLIRMARAGLIPYQRFGSRYYFRMSEVLRVLQEKMQYQGD